MPCHAAVSDDIFVLHLNANGGIINWNTYGGSTTQEEAWKIVVATVGNGITTFPGDYIIAGSTTNQNAPGMRDAYLLRIDQMLALTWDRQYGTAENDDYFFGVDEASPGFNNAGDIVAAGGSTSPPAIATDIFVCRVNGGNGIIGAAPQGQSRATPPARRCPTQTMRCSWSSSPQIRSSRLPIVTSVTAVRCPIAATISSRMPIPSSPTVMSSLPASPISLAASA
jgi:hypothetical protein